MVGDNEFYDGVLKNDIIYWYVIDWGLVNVLFEIC